MRDKQDNGSEWDEIVSGGVHPLRVAAVEAMRWIGEPFAPSDLVRMHGDDAPDIATAAHHMRALASLLPVLDLYDEEMIRGATRKLYYFRGRTPESEQTKRAA